MTTIGVLGGMGPDATIAYLSMVVEHTDSVNDQGHVDLICNMHCSIPDRTAHILDNSQPSPLPAMQKDIENLCQQGIGAIAVPCNTAHYFFEQLQATSSVPVLNMLELAASEIHQSFPDAHTVAVLGTRGTVSSGVYNPALAAAGLESIAISEEVQQLVDVVIFDHVKAGIPVEKELYLKMLDSAISAGADVVLLACTELSVPEREIDHSVPTVDALVSLAKATVLAAGKKLRTF